MTVRLLIICSFIFFYATALGQTNTAPLHLRNGDIGSLQKITPETIGLANKKITAQKTGFLIIQFQGPVSAFQKIQLAEKGIELLDYIPDHAYTASIKSGLDINLLNLVGARGIYELSPQDKMDASLALGLWPAHAVKIKGWVDVWISFPKSFSAKTVIALLKAMKVEVLSTDWTSYHVLSLRVPMHLVFELAGQPFIEFVSAVPPPDEPLNNNSRSISGASLLNSAVGSGGRGLNGEGIVIGVGDNADVQNHVDFSGRLISRTAATPDVHGTHTVGTVAGAGIINELFRGYLPKATIVVQSFGGILINASNYVKDYNMVITNNSYGSIVSCEYNGTYDLSANILDQQAFDFPYLQHVFAAGNSGNNTCAPFPQGFKTVLGGYQSAKNTLSVGNHTIDFDLFQSSSRGPVKDGRLKPDLTALGRNVVSTWQTNTYAVSTGTSMSAPAVSGGLGLLYQRYRQLNNNNDPKSGLMKALVCNGAIDRGNAGPDFKFGFGSMNVLRSILMLEANHYFIGNITNGSQATHSITVPANTADLKVLLYWHDPAASVLASKTLVNDLDLELVTAAGNTVLPFLLDSTATHVNDAAIQAADHTNNMEQVGIKNPGAGNYTIRVKGTAIAQNPSQEYFVVYDAIPNSIQLNYPVGDVSLVPGETIRVSWDAFGDEASTFNLQYSLDGGASWIDMATNLAAGSFAYNWLVPAVASSNAMVRVIKNSSGQTSASNAFAIIGAPTISLSATQCEGYIAIDWPAVANAGGYEIMMLKGSEMTRIATTTSTSYVIENLSKDSVYWVAVRAMIGDKWSRRSVAVSRQPLDGNCAGAISDNDLALRSLMAPATGRKFTSTELSAATVVKVEIKNLDDAPATGFTVKYSIDGGGTWVTENVTATIPSGGVYVHSFATPVNFSAIGSYTIQAVVINNTNDRHKTNDSLQTIVKHLANAPLNLTPFFIDNIETAVDATYNFKTIGIAGLDRYDFENTTAVGRLRTVINSGIAYSGTKSLNLDVKTQTPGDNINYLVGTYNLSNYNAAVNELRLDFHYAVHGSNNAEQNNVWIRGRDTDSWILMYDLTKNIKLGGDYNKATSLEISDSLIKYGQNFSSSFQVRWSQNGIYPTTEKALSAGTSLDDIRLYEVFNDVQLKSIDEMDLYNCGLSATQAIKITVRNLAGVALTNVGVKYAINDGAWVSEIIPSLAGNASLQFVFNKTVDLSLTGTYKITAVVNYPTDSYRDNDTVVITVRNVPLVSSFPYLQNFESNDGGWFSEGFRNSWQYGKPSSPKINTAASGTKAWKTNLSGNYNDEAASYLYSPCFSIASMSVPTLSFSVALDLEDCGNTLCDAAWVDYSVDGMQWIRLKDEDNSGTNWYNTAAQTEWSIENYHRWHVATIKLPKGLSNIRLRFVLATDQAVNREGFAIDDIHIYDNTKGIYKGPSITTPISQNINGGNAWIDFEKDGALVASVQSNQQNLGTTRVQAFINSSGIRNTGTQYYHDRNLVVQANDSSMNDSASLRFYFLDSETERLLNAADCNACAKPSSAYELGISKYDDYDSSFENGSINDNQQGLWSFIPRDKTIKVPFDKGYYVEFKVKEFSEFWLNNGALGQAGTLPVKMLQFEVVKNGADAVVNWTVASENNVLRYEIEVARGRDEMLAKQFQKIGEINSLGNSITSRQYSFVDKEALKTGLRYYRLKTINSDGSFFYSVIRSVSFDTDFNWQVLPNPSTGVFNLLFQLNMGEVAEAKLTDIAGRLLKRYTLVGNGSSQKQRIELSNKYPSAMYLLDVRANGFQKTFKLFKK